MRNKQSNRYESQGNNNQNQRHGARSEFEASREDTTIGPPQYPRGYSQSQGGSAPRYGAEYGGLDDAYPQASHEWQREDMHNRGQSYGPDYASEQQAYQQSRGSWQEPSARRMGQGYGESSSYGQNPGYGYGRGGREEGAMSYGYQENQYRQQRQYGQQYGQQYGHQFDQQFDPYQDQQRQRGQFSQFGASNQFGQQNQYGQQRQFGQHLDDPSYSGQSRQAQYRGSGPRNFTRSNERILEEVNERLTDDPWLDAADITVRCADGRVQLEGQVRDRWMKHRAEDIVDACMGVRDIDNRLQIQRSGQSNADSTAGRSTASSTEAATTSRGQGMAGGASGLSQSSTSTTTSTTNRPAH